MARPGGTGQPPGGLAVTIMRSAWLFAILSGSAAAQTVPTPFPADRSALFRDDVAGTRQPEDAVREGILIGNYRLQAGVGATLGYDENVLNLATGGPDSVAALIEPRLQFDRRGGPETVQITADARIRRFATLGSENSEAWRINVNGLLSPTSRLQIIPEFEAGQLVEPRGAGGTVFPGTRPSRYFSAHGLIGLDYRLPDLHLRLSGGYLTRQYEPLDPFGGGPAARQDYRDVGVWSPTLLAEYQLSPRLAVYARGYAAFTRSLPGDLGALTRDSDGYTALAGVTGELTPLLIVRAAAGWTWQDYRSANFLDYDGPSWNVTIDWYPTPLLSFRLASVQEIDNSGIANVPGILAINSYLRGYYEVRRDLLLSVEIAEQHQRFRELRVVTDAVAATLRLDWRWNRHLTVGLIGRYRTRDSNDVTTVGPYSGSFGGITLEARL